MDKNGSVKLWAVLKAYPWECVKLQFGGPLKPAHGEPTRLIPVFDTKEQAIKWASGDKYVVELLGGD
jgi:uncharacterized protein YciI